MASNNTTGINGSTTPSDDSTSQVLEALSLAVIMTCAITFNITALTTIIRVPSLRQKPHNLLLFNLAVADTSLALLVMPFSFKSVLDGGEFLKSQRAACEVNAFVFRVLSQTNILTAVAIGFDRVLIVTSSKILPRGYLRVAILITSVWLISVASALPCNFGNSSCVIYRDYSRCCDAFSSGEHSGMKAVMIVYMVLLCFVLPSLITSYSIIFVCLRRQAKKLKEPKRGPIISEPILTSALPSNPSGLRRVRFNMTSMDNVEQVNIHDSVHSIPELTAANCIPGNSGEPSVAARGLLVGLLIRNGRQRQTGCDVGDASPSVSTCGVNERGPDVEETSGDNYCEDSVSKGSPGERSVEPCQDRHCEISMTPRTKRKHVRRRALKRQHLAHRKVAMMGVMLVLAALVCYHPYGVLRLVDHLTTWRFPLWLGVATKWLSYSIAVVDPIIYTFMNRRARKELGFYRSTVKKAFSRKQHENAVQEKINEKI